MRKLIQGCKSTVILVLILSLMMSSIPRPSYVKAEGEKPTIYAVSTSHLDTVWDWDIKETIRDLLKPTFVDNMALLDKYPEYSFSFEQAFHYMLLKEYYPEVNERLKGYIDDGRWSVAGSALIAGDVNTVSAEAMSRNFLYGNNFFMEEYGVKSTDVYLPDSFGFSYILPSVARHMGLDSFMTQKLEWGSAYGIPFDFGKWVGVDGSYLLSYLNPGSYVTTFNGPLTQKSDLLTKLRRSPISKAIQLYGVGDRGGAPSNSTVEHVIDSMKDDNFNIVSGSVNDLADSVTQEQLDLLPSYDGELVMTAHGTGTYTSVGLAKRLNRRNEKLASAAEQANVAAAWLGTAEYPQEKLTEAWIRFLWHQFHDDLTGTSAAEVYTETFNDYFLSLNEFAQEYLNGVQSFIKGMDTRVNSGVAVVVHNSADTSRKDLVQATLQFDTVPDYIKVFDPNGDEVPSQIISTTESEIELSFLANLSANGYKVYNVVPSSESSNLNTGLSITENTLENEIYRVKINEKGDISSIFDKINERELLDEPIQLELFTTTLNHWPAWEINYQDINREPQAVVGGTPKITILEDGPAKVSLEVTRDFNQSSITQIISLYAGDEGHRVEVDNQVSWAERATLLKAAFPLSISNREATYDLGLGTIDRSNNKSQLYEVPAQQWASISNDGYGVSIMTDSKYGWDKPADNELRLSLIHTPAGDWNNANQDTMDFGENRFSYAIMGHSGDWKNGVQQEAEKFNRPMTAFQASSHDGELGKEFSFANLDTNQVSIEAIKKAEDSDEIIVRVYENYGETANDVTLSMGQGIKSAREVNGAEEHIRNVRVNDGEVTFSIEKYGMKSFAVTLEEPTEKLTPNSQVTLDLDYNTDVITRQGETDGGFGDSNLALPAEIFPEKIVSGGVEYHFGPSGDGENNAIESNGQTITLPSGYDRVRILANSTGGDKEVEFNVGDLTQTVNIQDFREHIGGWDQNAIAHFGHVKRENVAYASTHIHQNGRDGIYERIYLFDYELTIPDGATSLTLPDDSDITIMAITLTESHDVHLATQLYDEKEKSETFTLTVTDAQGSGAFPAGAVVRAEIDPILTGRVTWSGYEPLEGTNGRYIEFVMPNHDLEISANIESYGENLALNKPVTASSTVGGQEIPENMVNGTINGTNDKWTALEAWPQWAYVDLGSPQEFNRWVVKHAGAAGENNNFNTADFILQISDDGERWRAVDTVEGNREDITDRGIDPVEARYVRLYITKGETSGNGATRIFSFELYNAPIEETEPDPGPETTDPVVDPDDSNINPYLITGIVVIVVLAAGAVAFVIYRKKRAAKSDE